MTFKNDNVQPAAIAEATLRPSQDQIKIFREAQKQKQHRNRLSLLIVEDEPFSQKLLCEILRDARARPDDENPLIECASGIQEAWLLFLRQAPDIAFIDLNLTDGSGHTLAHAIREIDPQAHIIVVTSNNYQEELEAARRNNVDFFIAKPYDKKQILDCVASYFDSAKS